MVYYYDRFKPEYYDLSRFPGPRPGQEIPELAFSTVTGEGVNLSDYRGQWIVVETGSLTCNMYARHIREMNRLRKQFPDVVFLVIYVREAHPGSRVPQHRGLEDKIDNAIALHGIYGEEREILIDDMHGNAHRALGELPDMVYVLDPAGRIVYRHDWNVPEEIEAVLRDRFRIHENEHAFIRELKPHGLNTTVFMFKSMTKGGWNALWDFIKVMPRIIADHIRADRSFRQQTKIRDGNGQDYSR